MPRRKRSPITPTEDWSQLRLLFTGPEQETYELIRPVVLFGRSPVQRAKETGIPARAIYRKTRRFEAQGMASLFGDALATPPRRSTFPEEIRQAILDLKAEHPPFRLNELTTICYVRFGRRPDPDTVQKILAAGPIPTTIRRFAPYAAITDPIDRRLAIVQLHADGWNIKSIAAYLQTSRPTVYTTLRRWIEDGVIGLADKPHTRKKTIRKTDLKAITAVRRLQENPELGAFRIHAALKQLGIDLSPRTCGRILALNRKLYGLEDPKREPREPKEMPFKATRRHQYWTVDIRYLDMHQLGGGMIYAISILENYSRAILASALSRTQNLTAYLIVLFAAIQQHGSPEALVSDGGGIFRATQALRIYKALGIRKDQIEKRQAWQSYIETTFNIQRRMADWHFARATTWEELVANHDRWVADYNYQEHWAHRKREDNRRSPSQALGWIRGQTYPIEELHHIFYALRFDRCLTSAGYARFRQWAIYGERGLARQRAAVWLHQEKLTLEFSGESIAHYTVEYEADQIHLKTVAEPHLFETRFRSQQPPLWEPRDGEWLLALRRPRPALRRHLPIAQARQQRLFPDIAV